VAIINIGILAHVDAGKTSLTERILFETGVISSIGSVDKGTTQTDTLELERARGITIRTAVVSFHLNELKVNLIDTPGHADFVAEVERSLRVLDAAVLVVSAVEGVQAQTRRLVRAIRAANLPIVVFVNKIDRLGARHEALLEDIRGKLGLRVLPMGVPFDLGERSASVTRFELGDPAWRESAIDLLAETSERVIAEFDRSGGKLSDNFLHSELQAQIAQGELVPLYFGSAITGAGVSDLLTGVEHWLPTGDSRDDEPTSGTIFKITRRSSGEKIVFARLFAGSLAVRQRIVTGRRNRFEEEERFDERITGLDRFLAGKAVQSDSGRSGEIVCLHGLREARIGDWIGSNVESIRALLQSFPKPSLESVVRPVDPAQMTKLRSALEQLSEQDPLISLRQRNEAGEISVRLYGEVQKEIVLDTLARDYGVSVTFDDSRTICVERVIGTGESAEIIFEGENPFYATIAFRVEPTGAQSDIRYHRELGSLPLAFYRAIEETVYETLDQELCGWKIADCVVTLTHTGFSSPLSTAADFRKLTPLVLMEALRIAGTEVCEPFEELELDIPEDTFGVVCSELVNARARLRAIQRVGAIHRITCDIPTAEVRGVEQHLPGLTRGDAGWESRFSGYIPVFDDPPVRNRVGPNPLNRAHYLAEVARG